MKTDINALAQALIAATTKAAAAKTAAAGAHKLINNLRDANKELAEAQKAYNDAVAAQAAEQAAAPAPESKSESKPKSK